MQTITAIYPEEASAIRGAIFEVCRELGNGFREEVCQQCLEPKNRSRPKRTFSRRGIEVESFMDTHGPHSQYTFWVKPCMRFQRHQKPFSNILRASVPLCDTLAATFRLNLKPFNFSTFQLCFRASASRNDGFRHKHPHLCTKPLFSHSAAVLPLLALSLTGTIIR